MKKHIAKAPAIVDLNLLPRAMRPREVSRAAAIVAIAAFVAIVAVAPLSLRAHAAQDRASVATHRADDANRRLEALQLDLTKARALRVQTDETNAKADALRKEQASLQGGARPLGDDLPALWGDVAHPPGLRITRVTGTSEGFSIAGVAVGPLDAIAYARALVADAGLPAATMTSFTPGAFGGTFVVAVTR